MIDWLEYLWPTKSGLRKEFDNAIEKAITIMWLFGLTEIMLSLMVLIVILTVLLNWLERFLKKHLCIGKVWLLTLLLQAKDLLFTDRLLNRKGGWNLFDASNNGKNNKTTISFVCRDATDGIISKNRIISDIPILVVEIMAIEKTVKHTIQQNRSGYYQQRLSYSYWEDYEQNTPFFIRNLVDIRNLPLYIDNNTFQFCKRSTNNMTNRIAK